MGLGDAGPLNSAGLIMQGFGSLGQGIDKQQTYEREQAELSRPLSGAERYVAEIISGRMSPQEAAFQAKQEMEGQKSQSPFQTARDFGAATEASKPYVGMYGANVRKEIAQGNNETTKQVTQQKVGSAEKIAAEGNASKEKIAGGNNRTTIEAARIRAKALLDAVFQRGGTARDVALINANVRRASALRAAQAKLRSALTELADDPEATKAVMEIESMLQAVDDELADQMNEARGNPGPAKSSSGARVRQSKPAYPSQSGVSPAPAEGPNGDDLEALWNQ